MKAIWSSTHGGGGRVKFTGAKKLSADGGKLNTLVVLSMASSVKMNKNYKAKSNDNSES